MPKCVCPAVAPSLNFKVIYATAYKPSPFVCEASRISHSLSETLGLLPKPISPSLPHPSKCYRVDQAKTIAGFFTHPISGLCWLSLKLCLESNLCPHRDSCSPSPSTHHVCADHQPGRCQSPCFRALPTTAPCPHSSQGSLMRWESELHHPLLFALNGFSLQS